MSKTCQQKWESPASKEVGLAYPGLMIGLTLANRREWFPQEADHEGVKLDVGR